MKKIMKIFLIIILIIAALIAGVLIYASLKPAAPKSYWEDIESAGETETAYNSLGSYTVVSTKYDAPQDESDKDENFYQVWYPEEEGTYPLVVMVNGTGVPCNKYEAVFEHIASWGYVVIGNNYGTNWDGVHASETLDFALNTEEIAAMIDTDKIAVGGHSQGGIGAMNAITEQENGGLYKTAFFISPTNEELAVSLEWSFESEEGTYAARPENISIPAIIAAGTGPFDNDTVLPLEKMEEYYNALSGDKAAFRRSGETDHGAMLYEANGYVIAWLDYYLKDVSANRNAFYGDDPEIQTNERYQDFSSEEAEVVGTIFIGDSRTVYMNETVDIEASAENTYVVAEGGQGYAWLRDTAVPMAEEIRAAHPEIDRWEYITNLGVNDLYDINGYIRIYKELAEDENVTMILVSVNPVKDYPRRDNADIEDFNEQLQEALDFQYIDTYSVMMEEGFDTVDGLHYTEETNARIYELICELRE